MADWVAMDVRVKRVVKLPNGSPYAVPDDVISTAEAVTGAAKEAGLRNFRVFIGGKEVVSPEDAPATLGEIDTDLEISIKPFDRAG